MSDFAPAAAPRRATSRTTSRAPWPLVASAVVFGALVAAAAALWVHYGTALFFEMVRAGIAACL